MAIEQIKVGFDNFSYIIYDLKSKESAIVDPSTNIEYQVDFLNSNKLDLKYIINTHHHIDHMSKNKELSRLFPKTKIIVSKAYKRMLEKNSKIKVSESYKLKLGNITLKFLITPGHTTDGLCIIIDDEAIITGDTLFIDDCGRADLLGSNITDLFNSLQKIKKLSDSIVVYPGHDYGPKPFDSLGNQKITNKSLLAKDLYEFSKIS